MKLGTVIGKLIARLPAIPSLQRLLPQLMLGLALGSGLSSAHAQKGINGSDLHYLPAAELTATVEGYKALGVKWVRFDFDWSVMQPAPNTYQLEQHDRVVRALAKAQIKVLGIIAYTPSWANGGHASKFYPPTDPTTYANFAGFLTARYGKMGVSAWEIWNEPNLTQFWATGADPTAYTRMLKLSYAAIKKQNARITVVSGGLAQPPTGNGNMDARQFLELMYGSGAKPYFDAVGNHPYTSPQLPLDNSENNWGKMFSTTNSFLAIMSLHGDAAKKIWITEFGAPTSGTDVWGTTVSEERQAAMVTQSLALAATYAWAGPTIWYNYKDFCAPGSADSQCYFGLVRYDGTPKAGYHAYRAAP